MRRKNIKRAAEALFVSQGDDKNTLLAKKVTNEDARQIVKNQGRALQILEYLLLPKGKFSFSKDEIHEIITSKLEKKGHRIQDDEEEDDEIYLKEKQQARKERLALVPEILGLSLEEVEKSEEEKDSTVADKKDSEVNTSSESIPQETSEPSYDLIGRAFVAGIKSR